jgi:hypothetical protein
MKIIKLMILTCTLFYLVTPNLVHASTKKPNLLSKSTSEKQEIIRKSVSEYKGNCPCPWNTMKNGRSCGKNSAWSKAGGAKPICYEYEIK